MRNNDIGEMMNFNNDPSFAALAAVRTRIAKDEDAVRPVINDERSLGLPPGELERARKMNAERERMDKSRAAIKPGFIEQPGPGLAEIRELERENAALRARVSAPVAAIDLSKLPAYWLSADGNPTEVFYTRTSVKTLLAAPQQHAQAALSDVDLVDALVEAARECTGSVMLADAYRLRARIEAILAARQPAPRPTDDELWDQTIRDRDTYHDWADKLAEAIAKRFGVDIGEHSSANLPWSEALDAIEFPAPVAAAAQGDALSQSDTGRWITTAEWERDRNQAFALGIEEGKDQATPAAFQQGRAAGIAASDQAVIAVIRAHEDEGRHSEVSGAHLATAAIRALNK